MQRFHHRRVRNAFLENTLEGADEMLASRELQHGNVRPGIHTSAQALERRLDGPHHNRMLAAILVARQEVAGQCGILGFGGAARPRAGNGFALDMAPVPAVEPLGRCAQKRRPRRVLEIELVRGCRTRHNPRQEGKRVYRHPE